MAPPIPGLRQPAPARGRSAGDVVAGVLAVFALAVLIVGVPVALVTVLGLPVPHSKPALSLLTHQLSILTLIQILSVIVWLAWLQLVFCVVVEARAAIKNVGVPARIPLSGGTQAIAHRLVTASILLFTATATLSPAFAGGSSGARAAHTVSAAPQPGPPIQAVLTAGQDAGPHGAESVGAHAVAGAGSGASSTQSPDVEKIYVVKPPVGRFHESLWEIAENHLGNGLRYREIFEMNKDRPQPDGTRLTMAALIRPGWRLQMPRDAYGPGIEIVAPRVPGGAANAAEQAGASQAERATQAATGTHGRTSGTAPGSAATPSASAGAVNAAEHAAAAQAERATQAAGRQGSTPGTAPGPAPAPGASAGAVNAAERAAANQARQATGAASSPPLHASSPPATTPAASASSPAAAERTAAGQAEQALPTATGASAAAAEQAGAAGAERAGAAVPPPGAGSAVVPGASAAAAERAGVAGAEQAGQAAAAAAGGGPVLGGSAAAEQTSASQAARAGRAADGGQPVVPGPAPLAGGGSGASGGPGQARRAADGGQPVVPGPVPLAGGGSGASGGPGHTALGPAHAAAAGAPLLFPHELAASSLLAAGLLTALGRRKREQLWRRAYGSTVPMPEGSAAMAETAMRLGANESAVRTLDIGLRSLSQELAARGKTPPTVFAAHIGQVNLDLWIAIADKYPPPPWQSVDDGQVWRLPLTELAGLDPDDAGAALAPYPGLISIGTSDTGRMLLDLEVAHGLIAVRGTHTMVQAVLAAVAVELATNRWSDRMRITLVGFGPDLATIAPDRITVARTLDEAMPALEARAAEIEHALASLRADADAAGLVSGQENSVLTGRSRGLQPDSWTPHYLISAIPPTPQQRERLLTLANVRHRTAMGYVVAGEVPGAAWSWDINEQGQLHAGVLGFDLRAQLLPAQQCAAVVDLFRTAAQDGGIALAEPPPDAAPTEQLVPGSRMAVEVSLLGQVAVQAPGSIEPARIGAATEIVAYLAAHPEGVQPNVLAQAIWPRGVAPEVRDSALARVRDWLGDDTGGEPNLVTDAAGRMSLGPRVRVDWQVFRSLVGHAIKARRTAGPPGSAEQGEAAYLARALQLIQGQLLDGHDQRGYSWLAADALEYEATAQVADVAHRLCELRLAIGDAEGAMEAARSGLRFAFYDELLWRDLLVAAHATGQEHVLRSVVGELSARVSLDEVLPRMAPETEALIDQLLPSWRSSVA